MFKLSTKLTLGPILIIAMMLTIGIITGCGNSENSKSNDKKSGSLHINAQRIVDAYSNQGYLLTSKVHDKGPFHTLRSTKKNLPIVILDGKVDDINWVSITFPIFLTTNSSDDTVEKLVKVVLQDIFLKDSSEAVYKEMMSNALRSVEKKQTDKNGQVSFGYVRGDKDVSGFVQAVSDGALFFVSIASVTGSSNLSVGEKPLPSQTKEYFLLDTNKINPGGKIKVYESQIPNYYKYVNGRYLFSIDFPTDLSVALEASNLSGANFSSPDRQVKVTVSGSQNSTQTTNSEEYNRALKGKDVAYSATGTDWHTVSWKENGKIFYMKTFVSLQYLTGFLFEYPENQKYNYEPIVGNLDKTFNPGWNTENKTGEKIISIQSNLDDGRWQKVENFTAGQRLQIWNPSPIKGETVEYTGGKISAYELTGQESGFPVYFVHNKGVAKWYVNGQFTQSDEGTYYGGKRNGEFIQKFADGRIVNSLWENGVKIR